MHKDSDNISVTFFLPYHMACFRTAEILIILSVDTLGQYSTIFILFEMFS